MLSAYLYPFQIILRNDLLSQILMHAAKNFAQQEHGVEVAEANLKKLALIATHLEYQMESIDRSSILLEEVTERVRAMQR